MHVLRTHSLKGGAFGPTSEANWVISRTDKLQKRFANRCYMATV